MIKGGIIVYDSSEELPTKGQCCLRVSHFFYSSIVLLALSGSVFVASFHVDSLEKLRTPAGGVLVLSLVLGVVCGFGALFVECRVHERYTCCKKMWQICGNNTDQPYPIMRTNSNGNMRTNATVTSPPTGAPVAPSERVTCSLDAETRDQQEKLLTSPEHTASSSRDDVKTNGAQELLTCQEEIV